MIFFLLVSLGVFGKQLTYYFELKTEAEKEEIADEYKSYAMSMKSIVAFNVIILIFIPLHVAGTWYLSNGSCIHKIL